MMIRCALALTLCVLLQSCGTNLVGEKEADWIRGAADATPVAVEQPVVLPAFPKDSDLAEFGVGASASHHYFVDVSTIDIGADGVVRYALIVKTAGGARNASYEGIRCGTYEKRVYALGHPQRKWVEARRSVWEPIQQGPADEHYAVLYAEYFCPDRRIVANRAEVLRAFASGLYGNRAR